jgi:hypothetical protein
LGSAGVRWWDWVVVAGVGVLVLGLAVHYWAAWLLGIFVYLLCLWIYFNWRVVASTRAHASTIMPPSETDLASDCQPDEEKVVG